jgi:hypothetical protein
MGSTHTLKTRTEFFSAVWDGTKSFEMRYDDRAFRAGDLLVLQETASNDNGEFYTGRELGAEVTYVLAGLPWLAPGYVCMAIRERSRSAKP